MYPMKNLEIFHKRSWIAKRNPSTLKAQENPGSRPSTFEDCEFHLWWSKNVLSHAILLTVLLLFKGIVQRNLTGVESDIRRKVFLLHWTAGILFVNLIGTGSLQKNQVVSAASRNSPPKTKVGHKWYQSPALALPFRHLNFFILFKRTHQWVNFNDFIYPVELICGHSYIPACSLRQRRVNIKDLIYKT